MLIDDLPTYEHEYEIAQLAREGLTFKDILDMRLKDSELSLELKGLDKFRIVR